MMVARIRNNFDIHGGFWVSRSVFWWLLMNVFCHGIHCTRPVLLKCIQTWFSLGFKDHQKNA